MCSQSEFSESAKSISTTGIPEDLQKLKCNLDLFVIPDNCTLLFLDKCIGYFDKFENKVLKNSKRGPL